MNIEKMLEIQSALNEHTLSECNVYTVPDFDRASGPLQVPVKASMSLAKRDGTFVRHKSPLVQLIDMYQWAGNRELLELQESLSPTFDRANARIEIVDIMHFDLSILILTGATNQDFDGAFGANPLHYPDLKDLVHAREQFDNLQLRKWWTTKTVTIQEIRDCAITQFRALIQWALECTIDGRYGLFESTAEIEDLYLKKVDINYNRIKAGYNHVANKEMGNASLK